MDSSAGVAMVIVVVLIATIVLLRMRRKKLLAQLSPEELRLHEQCSAADKAVRATQQAHDKAVRAAETALKKAQTPERLSSAGHGNYVTPIDVCLNGRAHPLSEEVTAVLDGQGDVQAYSTQRSTLTRMAAGGMVAGPAGLVVGGVAKKTKHHKIDTRELYLMVLGPDWQEVAKLNPQDGDKEE